MALLAAALEPALPGARVRALAARTTATQVGFTTAALLTIGILLSIATTPDPLWWQLHFSRLGAFSAFSGHVFNATIVLCGAGVVVFATMLRVEMGRHAGTAALTNRRAAVVVPVLVALLGINLSLVGFFPVNVNEFLHDRGATGAVFCFILILASSRWMLRGMHRAVAHASRGVGMGIVMMIAVYVAGFVNLAAFELIVFSQVFSWLLLFARNVGRPAEAPRPSPLVVRTIGSTNETVVMPRRHRTIGCRSSRTPTLLTVAGSARGDDVHADAVHSRCGNEVGGSTPASRRSLVPDRNEHVRTGEHRNAGGLVCGGTRPASADDLDVPCARQQAPKLAPRIRRQGSRKAPRGEHDFETAPAFEYGSREQHVRSRRETTHAHQWSGHPAQLRPEPIAHVSGIRERAVA